MWGNYRWAWVEPPSSQLYLGETLLFAIFSLSLFMENTFKKQRSIKTFCQTFLKFDFPHPFGRKESIALCFSNAWIKVGAEGH